jgi:pyruvate/2-oxoglutarate dehydrogenase complex dihydrolipoamide acyltransferase (E2) component
MAQAKGKVPKAPQERVDAELVSDDYEPASSDEALESGDFFDFDAHDEAQRTATSTGATSAGATIQEIPPSTQINPYVSPEEQGMEMTPAIVGPPPYGSPDALTTVGRLVPVHQHPLNAENLPDDHPAAISEDYGDGQEGTLKGAETVTPRPGAPVSEMEDKEGAEGEEGATNGEVDATQGAQDLAAREGVDLSQVEGTGEGGRITKTDVENHLNEQDQG